MLLIYFNILEEDYYEIKKNFGRTGGWHSGTRHFWRGGSEKAADTSAPVKVGVTAGPHAEIMDEVKKLAAKDGLNIEVVEFNDFVTPNIALQQGEIFANSMQHRPYLDATLKKEPGFELVEVFKTVNFPMAVYSDKIKKGEAIPDGATIGIPNDPSNGGRALLLLAEQKLIEVKDINDVTTSGCRYYRQPA